MTARYLEIDGEHVRLRHRSRIELVARLREVDGGSPLARRLAQNDVGIRLTSAEAVLLAAVVGLWHAEDGVLPRDLSAVRDAAGAAASRQELGCR